MRLPRAEVEAFWAIGCGLAAPCVPDDELERALGEGRVQVVEFASSMGTAELWWRRSTSLTHRGREYAAVVPPGQLAEDWDPFDALDDRDFDRLWYPFRWAQYAAIARAASPRAAEVISDEVARRLVLADRARPEPHALLQDWLVAGGGLDPEALKAALGDGPRHELRDAVFARWMYRRVDSMLAAADTRDLERHMDLLRFAVRALAAYPA